MSKSFYVHGSVSSIDISIYTFQVFYGFNEVISNSFTDLIKSII